MDSTRLIAWRNGWNRRSSEDPALDRSQLCCDRKWDGPLENPPGEQLPRRADSYRILSFEEVVPIEAWVLHPLGEVDDARRRRELRHVGAVLIGDVGLLPALERHGRLLEGVVAIHVLEIDVDVRVLLLETGDHVLDR